VHDVRVMASDELAARTRRATSAAAGAGSALGLRVTAPTVLYDVFSVVVHLAPEPVVVRVPTVLPRSLTADEQYAQQQRELAVTGWLAAHGHPVVAPSPLVPTEPVRHDAFSMTFWQLVAPIPGSDPTAEETGRHLARLHTALAPCPLDLRFMVPLDESVPDMLDQLHGRPDLLDPADLARACREWEILAPVLTSSDAFTAAYPQAVVQPIHGDAPSHNVLHTPDGALDSDFEHVGIGPVEWDLTFCGPDVIDAYDAAAARPADRELVAVLEAARMVQLVACFAMVPQLPMLAEGLRPALENWRTTPVAGGITG
jgi:Ser/Thr protein kinase RdoA (MazF antagonist)